MRILNENILKSVEYIAIFEKSGGKSHWYGYPRGFVLEGEIYINDDAFFLDDRDRILLVLHEQGHIDGKEHTSMGLMSPYGLVRYFTA